MDFVDGLGESSDVMEIPVDGVGRVEIHRGRVRVTLTRIVERNGMIRERPCLTLVWSLQSWLEADAARQQIRAAVVDHRDHQLVPARAH